MNSFAKYWNIVQNELIELQKEIQPPSLKEQINYFLTLGGKRLRPSLLLAGCDLFNGDLNKAIKPALGIELFHNFTLIHDDVMDEAPLRRNKETLHKKWNTSTAILAGDAMYASAFSLITSVEDKILTSVIKLFCKTAIEVCEGQQLDMDFENKDNVTIDDYLRMIELKTAVLLACSLKIGAMVAGADEKNTGYLFEFGKNIGIAFQLQDDILDVYGEQEKFGKQVGGDIFAGKKTFPLLKALEMSSGSEHFFLLDKNKKDIQDVISIYNKYNVKDASKEQMNYFYEKAIANLNNLSASGDRMQLLLEFAEKIIKRDY